MPIAGAIVRVRQFPWETRGWSTEKTKWSYCLNSTHALSSELSEILAWPQKSHQTKAKHFMKGKTKLNHFFFPSQALSRKVIMEDLVPTGPQARNLHFKVWQIFIGLLIFFPYSTHPPPVLPASSFPSSHISTLYKVQTWEMMALGPEVSRICALGAMLTVIRLLFIIPTL